ncbi:uncharacterized protein K460DRAFT_115288 [Cucurbitaria berberidis CBS 394.84]|uniref:Probable double zinc ribbon domain-containing protein n=1 Tax=Cucurbitaria berberidis CBS 394.84 TaxID=1168544 RepID=A0A9P4L881_9PLEO|nr:uncharacterized protein K460DRAFT_115288 [Cucurbitaria berberidis CBS 394.84]KAF1845796.1 hypothetical protein K460DRAFT_115288 [Cucurbitaria berberidis CBS 394.84]
MPSIFRPVTAFARKALKINKNAEKSLARKLDAADRAHPPPRFSIEGDYEYIDYTETSRDYLHHLLDKIDGDGLWKCCRGHEQELIHWKGEHPFKRLRCNTCEHILCHRCESTTVLTRMEGDTVLPYEYHEVSGPISYGQICSNCGLTHRARGVQITVDTAANERVSNMTFANVVCVCGHRADNTWLHFWIGPIYEYRRNPHDAFASLSRQRAESSVRRQQERLEHGTRRESLPCGSSSRGDSSSNLSGPHAQWSISTSNVSSPPMSRPPSSQLGQPPTPWMTGSFSS